MIDYQVTDMQEGPEGLNISIQWNGYEIVLMNLHDEGGQAVYDVVFGRIQEGGKIAWLTEDTDERTVANLTDILDTILEDVMSGPQ